MADITGWEREKRVHFNEIVVDYLKKWYEENGFINIGYKNYDGAPFTVGRMECTV